MCMIGFMEAPMISEVMRLDEIEVALRATDPRSVVTADFVRKVRISCHPDLFVNRLDDRERADRLRRQAESLYYELSRPPLILKNGKSEYTLGRRVAAGD